MLKIIFIFKLGQLLLIKELKSFFFDFGTF